MSHRIQVRVYYEDTDAGGVVFHANFLNFCERGRTEFLRSLGFQNTSLKEQEGLIFVARRLEADYLKPAFLDDLLEVETTVTTMKNASFEMKQSIFRQNDLIFSMNIVMVSVGAESLRPVKLTDALKNKLEGKA